LNLIDKCFAERNFSPFQQKISQFSVINKKSFFYLALGGRHGLVLTPDRQKFGFSRHDLPALSSFSLLVTAVSSIVGSQKLQPQRPRITALENKICIFQSWH